MALGVIGPSTRAARIALQLLPDAPHVDVDRVQIQQVLVNLIRNALDAMEGLPKRDLTITSGVEGGEVKIAVRDTGLGVPADMRDRIFGAFVTTKKEGMGVGLSICQAIVENHGGRIWFEANEAGGTTFSFTLPIRQDESPESLIDA